MIRGWDRSTDGPKTKKGIGSEKHEGLPAGFGRVARDIHSITICKWEGECSSPHDNIQGQKGSR